MNQKRKKSRLLLAVVLARGSAAAVAEVRHSDRPGSQDSQFNAWVAPFLEELHLTQQQKPKFLAIQKAMTTKWAELRKLPANERQPEQEAFFKARHAEIVELLTPKQMKTYRAFQQARKKQKQP